ncbi:MAG: hypothetical protein GFH27_549293n312 [Chloroflexi bacterium AL-W]|nr:hypothetical protein [Chloroflexi bacterium AL-N1]NOK67573.1 hypothetical protein [Chloroflexi bacterium AL-N10]NOK75657.1 hypothetical protein [Chloroflexi bacterium AL-N5]NOK82445.1 hypothetical protein [Chloroflexi bacterium AL-W]NOK90290.1 hypothetical protein [Chloroflexi bacterium AL-N15]
MEAARNFLQHRSLIISSTFHQAKRIEEEDCIVHTGKVNLSLQKLRAEGGFKSTILSELEAIADKKSNIDIRPLVREYISALGEIHLELRKMFESDASKYDRLILNAIQQLNEILGEDYDSVYVATYNENDRVINSFVILKDFVECRQRIIKKTQHVTHYVTSYVSSK